jgi:hypothetical protein
MTMVRRLLFVTLAVFVVLTVGPAGTAAAQGAAGQPVQRPVPPGGRAEAETPDVLPDPVLANMLDTYAIVEAQKALTIADERYGTFAARLKKLQDIRRRNQRQRHQMVRELARMAGPRAAVEADEAAIRAQLTALRAHDERAALELRQAYDALDEILDTRQQARFRMFEKQIEQRKLELLVRARERARQKQRQQ